MSDKKLSSYHDVLSIRRRGEIVPREEYLDYMTFRRPGRPMFTEIFGPLVGLKDEWRAQGASAEELEWSCFRYRYPGGGIVPVKTGFIGGQPERILEETDDHVLATDAMGRTVKLSKRAATIPLPMDHPVKTMDDWKRIKHHYQFSEDRFGKDWLQAACKLHQDGKVVIVSIPGGFDEPRQLMGEEALCLACFDQPELIEDILTTIGETAYRVLDRVSSAVQVDELSVHEDMAGRSGPLFGPAQVERFMVPYYRRVWDLLSARGARIFKQDSDGDVNAVIPAFLKGGVNLLYPLEPAAGMDAVKVRRTYGKQAALMGGLDKFALLRGEQAIVDELEYKIPPLVATGGVILGLDHRIPNGVPLEAYRFYIRKAWEIIERESQ